MLRIGLESPKELGIMGLADGGDGGYADETLLKCAAALESPDALCLSACDREQLHVSLRRACMSVFFFASACGGEAGKAAAGSSEFSHGARLGEQATTSRQRCSAAIFRPPLPPAGKWGRGAT